MSELLLNCDRCELAFSASTLTNVSGSMLCPRCALEECAEFCRGEGWIGKAMEYEKRVGEMDKAKP